MKKPVWNVICIGDNRQNIEVYNIFEHGRFWNDVKEAAKKYETKREFAEQLRRDLQYYFWSKCEWEMVVNSLFCKSVDEGKKIDVYWQVRNNWDIFVDYTWSALKK